ncbi:MAG: hypothetical protein LBH03_05765 [Holophagales bacterium]|nr:hypothetical protein [Holophagales bacterium]
MATETDRVFGGLWMGIDLDFFSPLNETPERYSKLMKNVFNKHIRSVEAAIRLSPQNAGLWNIWAWMASSLQEDYQWGTFVDSVEPFDFPTPLLMTCPPAPVSVWIVREAKAKKDWDTVIRLAKNAREFRYHPGEDDLVVEWIPGHGNTSPGSGASQIIEGFPGKSAYAPHLEALLATGRIDEANGVYDEMIRVEGKNSTNTLIAADVAEQLGMQEIAANWKTGCNFETHLP